jgi:hypothetical protein
VIFHHVEAFVLDLPARPAAGDDFGQPQSMRAFCPSK